MRGLVANREAWDERRDSAVALPPAGAGRTTVGGSRGRGCRGGSQQSSHSSFVSEDTREAFDPPVGASAALEHVEGLGPGRGWVEYLGEWSSLRTRKGGCVRNYCRVDWDGGPVQSEQGDEIKGDKGFPGSGDYKLRWCRSSVNCCCDVNIKCGEALRAGVEEAVGGEYWWKSELKGEEDGNGRISTVNEFERVELSNECEFSLEGVCHSSQAGVVLDVGQGHGCRCGGGSR